MFDIFLDKECNHLPDITDLETEIPLLVEKKSTFFIRPLKPDFLGLDISAPLAGELYERIVTAGGYCLIVPSKYRQPIISIKEACKIAEPVILHKQRKFFSKYLFEPIKCNHARSTPMYWAIGSLSEQLIADSYIPGGVFVEVDRIDGHIWNNVEQRKAFGESFYLESASNIKPIEFLNILEKELRLKPEKQLDRSNQVCLKGFGLTVKVSLHQGQEATKKIHNIDPKIYIQFRIVPSQNQVAYELLLKATIILLSLDSKDAVLWIEEEIAIKILLKQFQGKLTIDLSDSFWKNIELQKINLPYEIKEISPVTFRGHLQ